MRKTRPQLLPNPSRPAALLSDRAKRYRALKTLTGSPKDGPQPPNQTPNHCHYCGSYRRKLDAEHINGNESDGRPANLAWACRPCNAAKGAAYARLGKGIRTNQRNPRQGDTFQSYISDMKTARSDMSSTAQKDAAWKRILSRSKATRSDYARQLYQLRRERGTAPAAREAIPF